jgi:hypothetical protein
MLVPDSHPDPDLIYNTGCMGYLLVKNEGGAGGDVKELEPGHSQTLCLELQVLCSRQSWNTNFSTMIYGQE